MRLEISSLAKVTRLGVIAFTVGGFLAACESTVVSRASQHRTSIDASSRQLPLAALIDSLRHVQAIVADEPSGAWSVTGADGLYSSIVRYDSSALKPLATCIADTALASATYKGNRVRVGLMCYSALRLLAYSEGGGVDGWPGSVLPDFTPQKLAAASTAWLEALRRGEYKLD